MARITGLTQCPPLPLFFAFFKIVPRAVGIALFNPSCRHQALRFRIAFQFSGFSRTGIVRLHANFRLRGIVMQHVLCLLGDALLSLWKAACTLDRDERWREMSALEFGGKF